MPRSGKKSAATDPAPVAKDDDIYSVTSDGKMDISNDVFLFTGFRDGQLEHDIRAAGGAVASSMNSSVTVVITKDENQETNKVKAARERGIDIVTKEIFEANTGFVGKHMPDILPILAFRRKQAVTMHVHAGTKRKREDEEPGADTAGAGAEPSESEFTLRGEICVFTGFRDKSLEARIRKAGGVVMPHMTKAVTVVIAKDGTQNTTKARAAVDRGLRLVMLEDILAMLDASR